MQRTVLVHLAGALGVPVVPDGDEKFNSANATGGYVRVSFRPLPELPQGRVTDGNTVYKAARAEVVCACDCYAQGNGLGDAAVVDDVEGLASRAAHALRYRDLPLINYTADPSGATGVSGVAIRFQRPPSSQHLPPASGWQRRLVTATGTWFLRHAE